METYRKIGLLVVALLALRSNCGAFACVPTQSLIRYYLFTNENPTTPQRIDIYNLQSLQTSNYKKQWPLRVTVHGYFGSYTSRVTTLSRNAYLSTGKYNIIAVDWSRIAFLDYYTSVMLVKSVGEAVAEFLIWLTTVGYLANFDNVHLVGHSLGTHVCGFCGKYLNGALAIIHGLDPAGPEFNTVAEERRLATTDAKYVQIIHTNAGQLGINKAIGHVDFFPQYGKKQPACGLLPLCSHQIVWEYFAEAITNPEGFYAKQCSSPNLILQANICDETGIHTQMASYAQPPEYYGSYYFPVNDEAPYGVGVF